jgi:hypothetical protein
MMICIGGAWLGVVLGAGVGVFSVVFGKRKDTQAAEDTARKLADPQH